MNYIRRGTVSVLRRPGKSLILLVLLLVLGTLISGAASIRSAIYNTEANLWGQLPAVAALSQDFQGMQAYSMQNGDWPEAGPLDGDIIMEVGQLPYVRDFDFSLEFALFHRELTRDVELSYDLADLEEWEVEDVQRDWNSLREEGAQIETFQLRGTQNPTLFDIHAELITLTAGRLFTQEEVDNGSGVAIISQAFADANQLQVGSIITMENNVYDARELWESGGSNGWQWADQFVDEFLYASQEVELEIVGIFEPAKEFDYTGGQAWTIANDERSLLTRIYIPNSLLMDILTFQVGYLSEIEEGWDEDFNLEKEVMNQAIFALDDPRNLGAFAQEAEEILPDWWLIEDLSSSFGEMTSSMDSMLWIANLVLWTSIGATLVIMSLLITLFLRDRKQEIGVYLALGERRGKVISQMLMEVLSVAVIAIGLSLLAGTFLSSGLSRHLLETQLLSQDSMSNMVVVDPAAEVLRAFSSGEKSVEDMMAAYDTSLQMPDILLFFGVGMATVTASTAVPIIYLTRFNPKKIML